MATLTGNSLRREQRIQSLMLDRLVQRYERRIMREINRAMRAAAKAISNGVSPSYGRSEHGNRISGLLNDLWFQSGLEFAEHILSNQKAGRGPREKKQMDDFIRDWIKEFGGIKITQISDTTLEDINDIVAQGIIDGESERQIAKRIRAVASSKSASRAQTIARTESHAAANASAQASAEATGADLRREWVPSAFTERSRESHHNVAGPVGMNEPFIVDGEELRYPGDPNGSPGNVINCRCAVVFVL